MVQTATCENNCQTSTQQFFNTTINIGLKYPTCRVLSIKLTESFRVFGLILAYTLLNEYYISFDYTKPVNSLNTFQPSKHTKRNNIKQFDNGKVIHKYPYNNTYGLPRSSGALYGFKVKSQIFLNTAPTIASP